jgi:hypothetical protein
MRSELAARVVTSPETLHKASETANGEAHGNFRLRTWVSYSVKNPADANHRTARPP